MSGQIKKAYEYAAVMHADQKRKYTNDPYIVHLAAVATEVARVDSSEDLIVAAILHDIVEDTAATVHDVEHHFGMLVALIVEEVTARYTSAAFPKNTRAQRKQWEASRLSRISPEAQLIKAYDMLDNIPGIAENDKAFTPIYLPEKRQAWAVMTKLGDREYRLVDEMLRKYGY